MFYFFNENKRLVNAVFDWLSGVVGGNDLISVDFGKYNGFYRFEFPLRSGDRPKKIGPPQNSEITFVIRKPDKLSSGDQWATIFSSPEIEILENKNRPHTMNPLRWGFSDEERKIAFKIARDALQIFLEDTSRLERNYFSTLSPRFSLRADIDVALWINGRLRGSSVVEGMSLGEGIAEAAILSSRDSRFKPLSSEDLPDTRIEVTIMHDIRVPLSKRERSKNAIYPEKGYLLEKNSKKGWYLPEVFNVKRFRNLEDFLGDLAQEKAGLDRSAYKKADVFIFEVNDFIESADHSSTLNLYGPVATGNFPIHDSKFLLERMRLAADWLIRIQEPDGNFPPIIDSLTGRAIKQIDWPRFAFTAWSLVEFGKAIGEEKYIQAAEKSFEYLKQHLISNSQFSIPNFELTLAYFGQLSIALEKTKEARSAGEKLLGRSGVFSFDPITIAQIASFFKVLFKDDTRFSTPFKNLASILKENFEKQIKEKGSMNPVRGSASNGMNLAVWAELVNVFSGVDQEFSENVALWLKKHQLPNGAFPESTSSDFVYVRGTSKIFEVLALAPEKNKAAIANVLQWLFSMQYDEENTFFITETVRPMIIGGFRHDYLNQELWIDSAAHVILGGTRLIKNGFPGNRTR